MNQLINSSMTEKKGFFFSFSVCRTLIHHLTHYFLLYHDLILEMVNLGPDLFSLVLENI